MTGENDRTATLLPLNDGAEIPNIGLGTYLPEEGDSAGITQEAIGVGYRLIDTALSYGTEPGVGEGVRRSGLPRDEFVITSKLPGRYHGYEKARTSVKESLDNLGMDRIDLYLIHWPLPRLDKYVDTWKALIEMRDEGLLGSIGVSNFTPEHLDRIIDATGVVPAVNQIEMHPYFPQAEQRAYHAERGIVTEAWSPLGRGHDMLNEPILRHIAEEYGVTPPQVILRWHIHLDTVPIPKSKRLERLRENFDVESFSLNQEEIERISSLQRGRIMGLDPDSYEEF